ncbi:MAG TPA: CARDB domain-containing protein, partial [Candidatus Norongarragalinales archaeon]|nr:CARDB domain-containing protein [Candidatus Norongarragalinales archaeon]
MKKSLFAVLFVLLLARGAFAELDDNCATTDHNFYNLNDTTFFEQKLSAPGDVDWYKGYVQDLLIIRVTLVNPENRNYGLKTYSSCTSEPYITCDPIGRGEIRDCTIRAQGAFYFKVYAANNSEFDANAPYHVVAGNDVQTCNLEAKDGRPLKPFFNPTENLTSVDFNYTNQNDYGTMIYYFFSQLYAPSGSFMTQWTSFPAWYHLLYRGTNNNTVYWTAWFSPYNQWQNGVYRHKTFILSYCGLGYLNAVAKKSSSSPQVGNGNPNLQVTQIYVFPGNPTGGQPATIYVTTSETNNVSAPMSCTRLKIDGNDAAAFCQSIQAGNSTTGAIQVNLPVGNHNLTATADYWNDIQESNENDNTQSIQKYWKQPLFMNSQVENLRQRYYKNEAVQYDVYLTDQQNSTPLDGAYVTTFNPFTLQPDWQNTSQEGRYWFDWNATETGLKQFSLNSFKHGYYQKNNYRQVIVTPETARLYATVFNSTNKPVWGAKFKIDGEDRGAAGRNGQIVIPSERGDRRVQVSCPNNNACYDQNVYLNGNTERRFTCNCPDSTTNVVLNLTAFSDALPPNDEYISANGLPIANAMISVDDEFGSILNSTDAGGMLAVKNIPYGYHDFHFYYCLEWNNNTNQCKENSVWRSYSRANVQQGTRYVNFALNVDAMRPQGGQANFESFTYKDG